MSLEFNFKYVARNRGPYTAFLDRYERTASHARRSGAEAFQMLCANLPSLISDERNLIAAIDYLRSHGGGAAGVDGNRLIDLGRIEAWGLARDLRDRLCEGDYQRGPLLRCRFPKSGRPGVRTVYVANRDDRIVARAAVQIVVPLLEPFVADGVQSWRRRGAQRALARAIVTTKAAGQRVWITEDLRNAFDEVGRERLCQVLCHYMPNPEVCRWLVNFAARPYKRGILQGSPLSPPFLDIYLTHFLHRPWNRKGGKARLQSYVDDLQLSCHTVEEAREAYDLLAQLIQSAGLHPKHGPDKAIADVGRQSVSWLGYRLRFAGDELNIRSEFFLPAGPERRRQKHQRLVEKFARLHDRPEGWRYADSIVRGILNHLAPVSTEPSRQIYDQIRDAAAEAGFTEIIPFYDFTARWRTAHAQWQDSIAIRPHDRTDYVGFGAS